MKVMMALKAMKAMTAMAAMKGDAVKAMKAMMALKAMKAMTAMTSALKAMIDSRQFENSWFALGQIIDSRLFENSWFSLGQSIDSRLFENSWFSLGQSIDSRLFENSWFSLGQSIDNRLCENCFCKRPGWRSTAVTKDDEQAILLQEGGTLHQVSLQSDKGSCGPHLVRIKGGQTTPDVPRQASHQTRPARRKRQLAQGRGSGVLRRGALRRPPGNDEQ